ncbi:MAG: transposase, partial [Deltaproteobacteria bacterium]|nr:transposase [Deltaproteobacteria bacterium]
MRPIRNTDPSIFRLISCRTLEARVWMVPSGKLKKLIGGIIARYQEIFEIEIYAYYILGNHYHMLVRAPRSNIDEFCENINREIARRLNWKLKREGAFWSRRYDDIEVADPDKDLLEAFLYVTTNATRHGLLRNSEQWPGLHSFNHALNEEDRYFTFHHYSAVDDEPRTTRHAIKLSVLPQYAHLSKKERTRKLRALLEERMQKYEEERKAEGQGFLTVEILIKQEPGIKPHEVSKSNRPHCYTTCLETWKAKREERRERNRQYRE